MADGGGGRKIALFVDARSMHHAQKKLGWYFDPSKLVDYCAEALGNEPVSRFWYTSLRDAGQRQSFRDALISLGFTVRSKIIREAFDHNQNKIVDKSSLEAEMIVDILCTCDSYDEALVFSGDSNFAVVLEALRAKGKLTTVFSTQGVASRELRNACDRYIDIKTIEGKIKKTAN